MDRQLSTQEQRKGNLKRWLWIGGSIIAFAGLIWFSRSLLRTKADHSDFLIAKVEKGDVINTLTASGLVVPAFEREINAPVATEIKQVNLSTGSEVKPGDVILELDQEYTRLEYEKLKDELELRKNNIDKLKLKFDKDLRDLDYRDQIKALQVTERKAEVIDQQRLLEIGGSTQEELERTQLQLSVLELEKKMLANELDYSREVNVNEKKGLELEYKIQEKRLSELRRKLTETKVSSPQNGVITWINEDIGRTVQEGETLVKIADLNRYLIEATISDRNTEKISLGQAVNIRIGRKRLSGEIARISPTVENNTVKFYVKILDEDISILRPNMRAEIYVITQKKEQVYRIKNGVAFNGAANLELFFVEGNRAVKKAVKKGISNADYVEILSSVKLGEQIIISDTEPYRKLDQFILNHE